MVFGTESYGAWGFREAAPKKRRKCRFCGRLIPADAKYCPYCGKQLK